jgi:hypothetical protein
VATSARGEATLRRKKGGDDVNWADANLNRSKNKNKNLCGRLSCNYINGRCRFKATMT